MSGTSVTLHLFSRGLRFGASSARVSGVAGRERGNLRDRPIGAFDTEATVRSGAYRWGPLATFVRDTRPFFSARRVRAFAREAGVHPGIVVGRLQHMGEIPWQNLRRTLVKATDLLAP